MKIKCFANVGNYKLIFYYRLAVKLHYQKFYFFNFKLQF